MREIALMSWSLMLHNWPVTVATFLYIAQAYICYSDGKLGQFLMFTGYAAANIGIIITLNK